MNLFKFKFQPTSSILKHIKEDIEEEIAYEVTGARRYLNVLVQEITNLIEAAEDDRDDVENYDSPNWQLLQADNAGYRRALKKVIKIVGPQLPGEVND